MPVKVSVQWNTTSDCISPITQKIGLTVSRVCPIVYRFALGYQQILTIPFPSSVKIPDIQWHNDQTPARELHIQCVKKVSCGSEVLNTLRSVLPYNILTVYYRIL